ncbi:RIPOR family member 3 isoform 2-T4 [Clarias gariepinus]
MSVKLQFSCPAEGGMVQRSRSFTGVNSLSVRHRLSSTRTSLRTKGLEGRSIRIPTFIQGDGSIRGQQPEQVDKVFQALQKGLKESLEGHKTKLDFLSSQQTDTVKTSRLAFFYDLEKEIKSLERYIRRLEFQISKVEGLYETYCIQWRLCQGAVNMKRAFSLSPSSRASQESLLELTRNHRHSLEDLCAMEGELAILLGKLQIKMKGLTGFARLCPGDQYEVLIRLGRQRWRIKGQIQADDKQLWDEEEKVFLPRIHESFEIKVSEVKGLSSSLVGMVTCKCTDFYTPQMIVVDITELGTIKLQLEVDWSPFDSDVIKNLMSSTSRHYSQSRKRPALSPFVYETASPPPIFPDLSMDCDSMDNVDNLLQTPLREGDKSGACPSEPETSSPSSGYKQDTIRIYQSCSTPDILKRNGVVATNQELEPMKLKKTTDDLMVQELEEGVEEKPKISAMAIRNSQKRAMAMRVGLAQAQVTATLQEMSFDKRELKHLNLQIHQLYQVLKTDIYNLRTCSSEALDVEEEEVLGSFDFLSIDFNTEDNNSCKSSSRLMDTRLKENNMTSRPGMSEDTVVSSEGQHPGQIAKRTDCENRYLLSTGEYTLDQALEIHLNICIALLRALRVTNLDYMQQYILEELSCQTSVLEKITFFTQRKTYDISATELWSGAPKLRNLTMLWSECCGNTPAFCCTADSFLRMLRRRFIHKVRAKLPGQADKVFAHLVQQVQACSMMVPLAPCTRDLVSLFQLLVYLTNWKITNFGEHISHMSKEVYLLSCLESPKRRRVLKKLKRRRISELQPMSQTLQHLARLLTEDSQKVVVSANSCISRASANKSFRLKALVHYTWLLKDNDIQVQKQACLALKCLKALESAEQVAELWHSTDEDLRNAARETILSFGKKGHKAFQRMEQISAELQEESYKNLKTEITIL